MRAVRLAVAASLALAGWPLPASAAVGARALPVRVPASAAQIRLALPTVSLAASPLPAPSLSLSPVPSLHPLSLPDPAATLLMESPRDVIVAAPAAAAASAAAPAIPGDSARRLHAAGEAVSAEAPPASSGASRDSADVQFALLTGELAARRPEAAAVPADGPSVPRSPGLPRSQPEPLRDPEAPRKVKRMMLATSVMKAGMETVTLSIPLLVLQTLGGATMVAGLVVAYGLAQAAFGAGVEGLTRRWSARRVLAGAVAAQAVLVSSVVGLGALGLLTPHTLFPLYLLIGGAVGVIETSRRVIPPLLLGRDDTALAKYNARLHIFYEIAGVSGALGAGALIAFGGPLWSLLLQPPAYLLAAWLFWGVRHGKPAPDPEDPSRASIPAKVKGYLLDVREGARLVLGHAKLRWVALAFVLPQIVHRVFEGLLIPVFAKKVLEAPAYSAYLLTASNLGELVGAAILLKFAERFTGPRVWVKWGALGLLLSWSLVFTHSLPLLLPLIVLFSMTWASSDLALLSTVQKSVDEKDAPRAVSFLYGAFVVGGALVSLGMGRLLDAVPLELAFIGIAALFSTLGVAVWYASKKLD